MSDKKSPDLSRRGFLFFWRREDAEAPEAEPARRPTRRKETARLLRPPGALFESIFVDTCHRCGHCAEACPRDAIMLLPERFGASAGTPIIEARTAPCVVCEGLQCTQVCPSGALAKIGIADMDMGLARVVEERCVTFRGQPCAVCVEACPVPGALYTDAAGNPQVSESTCTGCGVCENVCPTPSPSIVVDPARDILT